MISGAGDSSGTNQYRKDETWIIKSQKPEHCFVLMKEDIHLIALLVFL